MAMDHVSYGCALSEHFEQGWHLNHPLDVFLKVHSEFQRNLVSSNLDVFSIRNP